MKSGIHTRSSGSLARKRRPARRPRVLSSTGSGFRCGTKACTSTNETTYVAASMKSTLGAPKMPISTPATGGPSSIVARIAPWKSAFACVTTLSSSPSSSGTINRWAAKYGAPKVPSANATASNTPNERFPFQWSSGHEEHQRRADRVG